MQFLIGSLKIFILWSLFLSFHVRRLRLEYLSSYESDEFNKEEPEKPVSESGSPGNFGTGLGGLWRSIGLLLVVTFMLIVMEAQLFH